MNKKQRLIKDNEKYGFKRERAVRYSTKKILKTIYKDIDSGKVVGGAPLKPWGVDTRSPLGNTRLIVSLPS